VGDGGEGVGVALVDQLDAPHRRPQLVPLELAVIELELDKEFAARREHPQGGLGVAQRPTAQPPTQAEAEACFCQALTIARGQQAKFWELQAGMSLGRLCRQQGRPAEARPLLAETYGWFTEGFATRDLQEAKALLDQLS